MVLSQSITTVFGGCFINHQSVDPVIKERGNPTGGRLSLQELLKDKPLDKYNTSPIDG